MIYKVSEVVKELGVSRQTVYKKLRRNAFKQYIVSLDGKIGVTEEGLQVLKDMQCKEIEYKGHKLESKADTGDSVIGLQEKLLDTLQKQLAVYEEQLKAKDKQIEEKDKQINDLIQLTENGQILQKMLLSNTEIKLLAYREELEFRRSKIQEEDKMGILNKLKKKFKK